MCLMLYLITAEISSREARHISFYYIKLVTIKISNIIYYYCRNIFKRNKKLYYFIILNLLLLKCLKLYLTTAEISSREARNYIILLY